MAVAAVAREGAQGSDGDAFQTRLASHAPNPRDRAYLTAWALRRAGTGPADAIGHESLAVVANEIADNIRADGSHLERLAAFDGAAWQRVLELVQGAVKDGSGPAVLASLEEVALGVLQSYTPREAVERLDDLERLRRARGFLFVSSLSSWLRFLAIRALVDRDRRVATPNEEAILRDRGRPLLRDLIDAIARLPSERQRLALTLAFWRGEDDVVVTETLLAIADELVENGVIGSSDELFPLAREERLQTDAQIAQWLEDRYGKRVKPETVAVHRSQARKELKKALEENPNSEQLLDILLQKRGQRRREPGSPAGDPELRELLSRAMAGGKLRFFELLVEEDCPRFAPTLPLFVEGSRPRDEDSSLSVPFSRAVFRDLPGHLQRCTRCKETASRLEDHLKEGVSDSFDNLEEPNETLSELHELVQRTLARLLHRADIEDEVKERLLLRLRAQPKLEPVAIAAIQGLATAGSDRVGKAAWEALEKHLLDEPSALDGRAAAVPLEARPTRGADPVLMLKGDGIEGRLSPVVADCGPELRLVLRGLPERLEGKRIRLELARTTGEDPEPICFKQRTSQRAVVGRTRDQTLPPGDLRDIRTVYVLPADEEPRKRETLARDLAERSRKAREAGDLYEALSYAHQALRVQEEIGEREKAAALYDEGVLNAALGFLVAAEAQLTKAQELATRHGMAPLLVDIVHGLGDVSERKGEWPNARARYDEALELARELPPDARRPREASLLIDLAQILVATDNSELAKDRAREALTLYGEDGFGAAAAEHVHALAERKGGFYDAALEAVESARKRLRGKVERPEADIKRLQAEIACTEGKIKHSLGEYRQALEAFTKSIQLMYESGSRRGEAEALAAHGRTFEAIGQEQRAAKTYYAALERFNEIGDDSGKGKMHGSLARLHRARGELDSAAEKARTAVALRKNDPRGKAIALTTLGEVLADQGHEQAAIERFAEAEELRRRVGDRRGLAHTLRARARVSEDPEPLLREALEIHRQTRDRRGVILDLRELAEATGEVDLRLEAIAVSEELRNDLASTDARADYLATVADEYFASARSLADGSPERSLSIIEASRARCLLERVSARSAALPPHIPFDARPPRPTPGTPTNPFDPEALTAELDEDTAVIAYLEGNPFLAYVATRDGVVVRRLDADSAGLGRRIRALRNAIIAGTYVAGDAAALGRELFQPAREAIEDRTSLLLALDGPLHLLPLGAVAGCLADEDHGLGATVDVQVIPSLAVARALRSRAARVGPRNADLVLIAPGSQRATDADGESGIGAVVAAFDKVGAHVEQLVGAAATRERAVALASEAGPARSVHLVADSEQLWSERGPNGPGDLVMAHEHIWTADMIWNASIETDLLVLGADNSSVGKLQKGEGSVSLARAFLAAGARWACGTTLPFDSASAEPLFAIFYEELLSGAKPATALRIAQQAMVRRDVDPLHWAGWQIVGSI